jgi:bacteriorhodopsin
VSELPALAGLLVTAAGALAVGWRARGRDGWLPLVALALPLSSATWYLAAALGQAVLLRPAGPVYWSRYADGVVTLPLLAVGLGLLAGADRRALATAAALAAWTMATTLAATLSPGAGRLVWLAPSVGGFAALLWVVFGALTPAAGRRVRAVRAYVVGLWLCYPLLWALGPAGLALAPWPPLVWVGVALDALLKPGTALLLLGTAGE